MTTPATDMTTPEMPDIETVDLVSDFVCPWCYIGRHNLGVALGGAPVTLRWHPYFLMPDVQPGADRNAYLIARFGNLESARERGRSVEQVAAAAGLDLDMSKVKTMPNTADAHRLMRWAAGAGLADAVASGLFAAHFEHSRDISDTEVLADIAAAAGMDRAIVADLLAGDADRAIIEDQAERARDAGISGVPSFVLNGKLLVVGAQPADVLASALAQSREMNQASRVPPLQA
jgi:predicted DsbA family dithiol-disulfide isomerase